MSDEKTEQPTEHKLRKAREEGQMARSQDVGLAASALAAVGTLVAQADDLPRRMRLIVGLALDTGPAELTEHMLYQRLSSIAFEACLAIGPCVLAAALGAAVGIAAHVGWQVSPKAVQLKLSALDPAQGLKKIFSMKSLLGFGQMLVKALAIGFAVWEAIVQLLPMISAAVYQSPDSIGQVCWQAASHVLWFGVAVFVALAPVDFLIQHKLFMKGQMMSKDEVKREFKGQEGDPEIKGQRKRIAHELANEAPKQAVARADAVVVNPTHYAVAIRYRADEAGVPVVLAKGVDDAALEIRRHAEALGVPVFAHPPLARALHKVPVDHAVPEELFESVSVVLRWVDEIGARRQAGDAS